MNIHYIPNLFPKFAIVAHFIPYVVNGCIFCPSFGFENTSVYEGFCELKHETWIKWSFVWYARFNSTQQNQNSKSCVDAYSIPLCHFSFFTYWIFWSWWSGTQETIISLHPPQQIQWVSILAWPISSNTFQHKKMALFLLLTQWTSPLPSHKNW